jgi:hypothetical protein
MYGINVRYKCMQVLKYNIQVLFNATTTTKYAILDLLLLNADTDVSTVNRILSFCFCLCLFQVCHFSLDLGSVCCYSYNSNIKLMYTLGCYMLLQLATILVCLDYYLGIHYHYYTFSVVTIAIVLGANV